MVEPRREKEGEEGRGRVEERRGGGREGGEEKFEKKKKGKRGLVSL